MNIGILTLGLRSNYGGILQTAALYHFLESENFNPVLLRKYPVKNWKSISINILEKIPFQNLKGFRKDYIKYRKNISFFNKYMPSQSPIMYDKSEIEKYIDNNPINSIIVGSDQVWRYSYINDSQYETYFLNFNTKKDFKKVSYAASFGINKWEAPQEVKNVQAYLSKFSAISVRESSGVEICKNEFKQNDVSLVLDPTLLVDRSFYLNMLKDNTVTSTQYDCITYILDENPKKSKLIEGIHCNYNHKHKFDLLNVKNSLTVPQWVECFESTNFVVTDSFHGMVFSIIFNKQFIVIVNNNRGKDRFTSLCKLLGLEDRILDSNESEIPNLEPINYNDVNKKLVELKVFSKKFLLEALG